MSLEKELAVYKRLEPMLLREHRGKVILVHVTNNSEEWSIWCCYPDALTVGYQKYGLNPFLCKKIEDHIPTTILNIDLSKKKDSPNADPDRKAA